MADTRNMDVDDDDSSGSGSSDEDAVYTYEAPQKLKYDLYLDVHSDNGTVRRHTATFPIRWHLVSVSTRDYLAALHSGAPDSPQAARYRQLTESTIVGTPLLRLLGNEEGLHPTLHPIMCSWGISSRDWDNALKAVPGALDPLHFARVCSLIRWRLESKGGLTDQELLFPRLGFSGTDADAVTKRTMVHTMQRFMNSSVNIVQPRYDPKVAQRVQRILPLYLLPLALSEMYTASPMVSRLLHHPVEAATTAVLLMHNSIARHFDAFCVDYAGRVAMRAEEVARMLDYMDIWKRAVERCRQHVFLQCGEDMHQIQEVLQSAAKIKTALETLTLPPTRRVYPRRRKQPAVSSESSSSGDDDEEKSD